MVSPPGDGASAAEGLFLASKTGDLQGVERALASQPAPTRGELEKAASMAAQNDHIEVLAFLMDHGAMMFTKALETDNVNIFQIMYDRGWDTDKINSTMTQYPFMQMTTIGQATLRWLLDHGMNPNLPADRGLTGIRGDMTPLNAFAQKGRFTTSVIETMELLLARGAVLDPWILENAISWRKGARHEPAMLQWLVDHGADVNCPMRSGTTLLHAAVHKKNLGLVTFLLENGIDASAKDQSKRKTALEEARALKLLEISKTIEEHLGPEFDRGRSEWRGRLRPRRTSTGRVVTDV